MSRSKRTGGSKGYAFIELKDAESAKLVADCMVKPPLSSLLNEFTKHSL